MEIEKLQNIRMFLLDMDGTFYLGNQIFDCSYTFVKKVEETGREFMFLTNNSSKDRFAYQEKLRRMGFEVAPQRIFTSGEATTIYLNQHFPGKRVYLVGTDSLTREFERAGVQLVEEEPDLAVLGFDTGLTYQKLWKLCDYVRAGIPYIATHPDFNCPVKGGFIPDIGGVIALVEACTGRRPDAVIGKPNAFIAEAAADRFGVPLAQICMVGDRLYTDIALGGCGVKTALVLSGETSSADYETSEIRADFVFDGIWQMAAAL